jgi:hypothetical protein
VMEGLEIPKQHIALPFRIYVWTCLLISTTRNHLFRDAIILSGLNKICRKSASVTI